MTYSPSDSCLLNYLVSCEMKIRLQNSRALQLSGQINFFAGLCGCENKCFILQFRGGTSRQISGRAGYRVRKLNSGPVPGRVITTRNIFVFLPRCKNSLYYNADKNSLILNKHVIVAENVLRCYFLLTIKYK